MRKLRSTALWDHTSKQQLGLLDQYDSSVKKHLSFEEVFKNRRSSLNCDAFLYVKSVGLFYCFVDGTSTRVKPQYYSYSV